MARSWPTITFLISNSARSSCPASAGWVSDTACLPSFGPRRSTIAAVEHRRSNVRVKAGLPPVPSSTCGCWWWRTRSTWPTPSPVACGGRATPSTSPTTAPTRSRSSRSPTTTSSASTSPPGRRRARGLPPPPGRARSRARRRARRPRPHAHRPRQPRRPGRRARRRRRRLPGQAVRLRRAGGPGPHAAAPRRRPVGRRSSGGRAASSTPPATWRAGASGSLDLTAKEFALLRYFMTPRRARCSRRSSCSSTCGTSTPTRSPTPCGSRWARCGASWPSATRTPLIETVIGRGYRLLAARASSAGSWPGERPPGRRTAMGSRCGAPAGAQPREHAAAGLDSARSGSGSPSSTRCCCSASPPRWWAGSTSGWPAASTDEPVSQTYTMQRPILTPQGVDRADRGLPGRAAHARGAGRTSGRSTGSARTRSPRSGCSSWPASASAGWWPAVCWRPIGRITGVARDIQATDLSRRIALRGPDRRAAGPGRHVRRDARPHRRRVRGPAPLHPGGVARAAQPAGGDAHEPRRRAGRPRRDARRAAPRGRRREPHRRAHGPAGRRPAGVRPHRRGRADPSAGAVGPLGGRDGRRVPRAGRAPFCATRP